jgi:polysaccharide pyruvyl transferase WcaK-like protein
MLRDELIKLGYGCDYKAVGLVRDFEELARGSECVISARMHALILGHVLGLKVITIPLSSKLTQFQNEYARKSPADLASSTKQAAEEILINLKIKC